MRFARPCRWLAILLCGLTGCLSTRPCVDLKDHFKPGRMYVNKVTPYGGVLRPQGAPLIPPGGGYAPSTVVPPPVPVPPGGFAPGPPGPSGPFPATPAPVLPGGNPNPPVFPTPPG